MYQVALSLPDLYTTLCVYTESEVMGPGISTVLNSRPCPFHAVFSIRSTVLHRKCINFRRFPYSSCFSVYPYFSPPSHFLFLPTISFNFSPSLSGSHQHPCNLPLISFFFLFVITIGHFCCLFQFMSSI